MDSKVGRFSLEHLQDGLKRHLVKTLDLSGQRVEDDEFVTLMEMLKRDSVVQCIDCSKTTFSIFKCKTLENTLRLNSTIEEINLGESGVTTEGLSHIVNGVAACPSMKVLKLHGNNIDSVGGAALARLLEQSRSLERLDVSGNELGAQGLRDLAAGLRGNASLTELDANYNQVADEDLAEFGNAIGKSKLRTLCLSYNSIGPIAADSISNGLSQCLTLETLDLSKNDLRSSGAAAIGEALKRIPLKSLNLAFNGIGQRGAAALASVIRSKATLQNIDLNTNNLGVEGAISIAMALKSNSSVVSLDLSRNSISIGGTAACASMLESNAALLELGLADNATGNDGAEGVFRALLRNETLEKLDMEGNGLSDGVGPLIATVLQTNSTLRELHLHNNRLGLGTAEAIAKALPNTQSLEVLDLRGNMLLDEGGSLITNALKSNASLLRVYLLNNKIVGQKSYRNLAEALKMNVSLQDVQVGYTAPIRLEGRIDTYLQRNRQHSTRLLRTASAIHRPAQRRIRVPPRFGESLPNVYDECKTEDREGKKEEDLRRSLRRHYHRQLEASSEGLDTEIRRIVGKALEQDSGSASPLTDDRVEGSSKGEGKDTPRASDSFRLLQQPSHASADQDAKGEEE